MNRLIKRIGALLIASTMLLTPIIACAEEVQEGQNTVNEMQLNSGEETETNAESEVNLETDIDLSVESETTDEAASDLANEQTEDEAVPYSTVESVELAKNGVVQVNTVFDDANGVKHIISGGSGFIIGDVTKTEYIITSNHIVNVSESTKKAAFKYFKISNKDNAWSSITPYTEVVFENDVTVACNVVTVSENLDLCVLQMASPNHNRTPLTFLIQDKGDSNRPYATTDAVYGLGFPEMITYDKQNFYSNDQVTMSSGKIANVTDYNGAHLIQHDAQVAENNCGGPLLNENGLVIGMNELVADGNNYFSLDATDIAKILDSLGIEYNKMTKSEYEVWLHRNDVVEPEQEPTQPVPPTEVVPDKTVPKWLIVTIIVLIVLVVLLIALFVVLILSQKKKDAPKEKKPKKKKEKKEIEIVKPYTMPEINKSNESKTGGAAMETSALAPAKDVENGTTILGGSPLPVNNNIVVNGGTLIRKKTGDNILLCKAETTIGKDSLRVDYCVRDNSAISRVHAALKVNNSGTYLEDRGSTNGTFLNGIRLNDREEKLLNIGDIIRLGNEEFEYRK